MWQKLVGIALTELFKLLDVEKVKNFIDVGLDALENSQIEGEVDTAKEKAIAGVIALIRKLMNIDDKKYGSDKE